MMASGPRSSLLLLLLLLGLRTVTSHTPRDTNQGPAEPGLAGQEPRNLVGPPRTEGSSRGQVTAGGRGSRDLQEEGELLTPVTGQQPGSETSTTAAPPRRPIARPMGGADAAWGTSALLHRLAERLSGLASLGDQQLRRLDALEYRLTRVEAQGQERGEAGRAAAAEAARHFQSQAYQGGQLAAGLETLRQQQVEERQALQSSMATLSPRPHSSSSDVTARLQGLATSAQGLRTAVLGLGEYHGLLMANLSALANLTRQVRSVQEQQATRHGLSASLAELRYTAALTAANQQLVRPASPGAEVAADCAEVQHKEGNRSGVYLIQPRGAPAPFFAFCELNTRGGGWTVVQQRSEGTIDFYRDWVDYRHGFGNLAGEMWLGLDKLHALTSHKVNELLVELQDFTLDTAHAHYSAFAVGPEVEGYPLAFLDGYQGTAGDSLVYHAGMKFSTRDVDHDQWQGGSCAQAHLGAWWYNGCDTSNLNGRYLNGALPESHESQGVYWYDWHGPGYSLMRSRMLVRPRGFAGVVPASGAENKKQAAPTKRKSTVTPPKLDKTTEAPSGDAV